MSDGVNSITVCQPIAITFDLPARRDEDDRAGLQIPQHILAIASPSEEVSIPSKRDL